MLKEAIHFSVSLSIGYHLVNHREQFPPIDNWTCFISMRRVIWQLLCLEDGNRILEVMKRLVLSIKREDHIDDHVSFHNTRILTFSVL